MKALFIGIFAIIVIGVLYFTVQVIKSPQFETSLTPNPTTFGLREVGIGEKGSKIFVDINNGFSFALPQNWQSLPFGRVTGFTGFAPLIQSDTGKYLTISSDLMARGQNIDVDIEKITTVFPRNIQASLDALAGEDMDIRSDTVKKVTFKNGINGFRITYNGKTKKDVLVPQFVKGYLYAYYVRGEILLAYSAHISTEEKELIERSTAGVTSFLQEADIVLQEITIY